MRPPLRSAFVLGVLAGLVLALARALTREARPGPASLGAPPAPLPEPVIRSGGEPSDLITGSQGDDEPVWVAPVEGGCPDGYPIKAKVSSGIFHRPGGLSYERTRPDRCYPTEAAAEADGFRAAKR